MEKPRLITQTWDSDSTSYAEACNTIEAANNALISAEIDLFEAVAAARACGTAWASIGGALGVTRQAAQQRFSEPPEESV